MLNESLVHPTAIVSDKAIIGRNVKIGQFTTIYDNVEIADDTTIEGYCEIGVQNHLSEGNKLFIGGNSYIRSHSVFYEGSVFGEKLITGHRVTVREKTIAGINLQIGTLADIQGHCTIGDYVRMHSNVHIGQHSKIGNYIWIFPYVVLTNDPHPPSEVMQGVEVGDFAVISTMSVILPGVKIATGCLIGANSMLSISTKPHMLYSGNPAKEVCEASKIRLKDGTRKPAYPWIKHFHRGYPIDIIKQWEKMNSEGII
ncbi:acyltransferase [Francisella philomiragia]|uniref:acyltransferase n=1 Tax=Francisella philomiragia TaxID=28110 RepID=UPI001905D4A8|nr:N-acetyltransferase [Francisella philomiragia]MBK2267751.1 N-acetyltransferase [Francisella philomiragia]MBK2279151.1 N-acetyltransferase [Francisella philomiragia]MBK2287060.1 N-acetyltransferase [Francisella philomiragia]MBK2288983.1 N-acetyltransferase [Francisella philomiragia]MBK2290701.1 N-acetyltransferase [Francisella philomiragia]